MNTRTCLSRRLIIFIFGVKWFAFQISKPYIVISVDSSGSLQVRLQHTLGLYTWGLTETRDKGKVDMAVLKRGMVYNPLRRHRPRACLMLSHYSHKIPRLYCWSFVYNLPHRHKYRGQEVMNGYSQATADYVKVKWRGVLLCWMSVSCVIVV